MGLLPPPRPRTAIKSGRIYLHVLVEASVIRRLKREAAVRNYSPGEFLEHILDKALPKEEE